MQPTADSTIIKNPVPEKTVTDLKKDPAGWFKKNAVKIVILVLIIGVVLEAIFGGMSLFAPSKSGNLNLLAPRINGLTDASLSLVADKKSYKSGDQVTIDVRLFTGGYTTDSTDLVVKYDPAFLEPVSEKFAAAGTVYSEYPALQVDKEKGLIGVSGITLPGKNSFSGAGSFAKLYFKALKDGQTQVMIEFEPGATADSNVVLSASSKDILGTVLNADIIINGSPEQAPLGNNKSCESFKQACINASGNSGTQLCKGGSTVSGSCSYDPEFTLSCDACI